MNNNKESLAIDDIVEICGLMSDQKARRTIIEDVVNHCKTHQNEEECQMFSGFLKNLRLKGGFRDPINAPLGTIVQEIMNIKRIPLFLDMILPIWLDADIPLYRSCQKMWKDLSADTRSQLQKEIAEKEIRGLQNIADDFKNQIGFDNKTLILFAVCASAIENSDETEPDVSETEALCDFWENAIAKLDNLRSDGVEWRQLELFFSLAVGKREEKKDAEVRKHRENELENAIQAVRDAAGDNLAVLGLEELQTMPTSEISSFDAIDEAFQCLSRLTDFLASYNDKEKQILKKPTSMEEKEVRDKAYLEMIEIESEIINTYRQLLVLSSGFEDEADSASDAAEVESTAEETIVPTKTDSTSEAIINADEEAETDFAASDETEAESPLEEDNISTGVDSHKKSAISEDEKEREDDELPISSAEERDGEADETSEDGRIFSEADQAETSVSEPDLESDTTEEPRDFPTIASDQDIFRQIAEEDDLAAGYWLSRSFENSRLNPPVPSWMFAAIAGSRMLGWDSDDFVGDLLEITIKHSPEDDEIQKIFGTAAALGPSLIAPASGMVSWLKTSRRLPQMQPLVEAVEAFASRQYPLKQQDLSGVDGKEERENRILNIVEKAETFVRESSARDLKYQAATRIWRNLIGERGPIRDMLRPVMEDNRKRKKDVNGYLRDWRREEYITKKINERLKNWLNIQQEIVGPPKKHLFNLIHQSNSIAAGWIDLVEREAVFENRSRWLTDQILQLKNAVETAAPEIFEALIEIDSDASGLRERIGASMFGRSLVQLMDMLNIQEVCGAEKRNFALEMKDFIIGQNHSLSTLLADRLIWFPEIVFDDQLTPSGMQADFFLPLVKRVYEEERTLLDAARIWIDRQDFRYVEEIVDRLDVQGEDQEKIHQLEARYREVLEGSRETLRETLDKAVETIEQAVVDGIILEEKRADMLDRIEAIDVENTFQISRVIASIGQNVHDYIALERENRLHGLKKRWDEIKRDLSGILQNNQELMETVSGFVDARLDKRDTRIVEECFSHLSHVIEGGVEVNENLFRLNSRDSCYTLKDFKKQIRSLENRLENNRGLIGILAAIEGKEKGSNFYNKYYKWMLADRKESAKAGVQAFFDLKRDQRNTDAFRDTNIRTLLQFLGYRSYNGGSIEIREKYRSSDLVHVQAAITAGNLSRPIPEFGSLIAGGANILVIWERPVAETISSRIQELRLERQGVIIFYLGRLTASQRREILRLSRSENMSLSILDETLLAYLSREQGERLNAFLNCSLPFTAINPYKPFEAGDIPPEMFYGREMVAKELPPGGGSCLVYGGRQLGKSALLREVQRNFHNPELNHYAWVEDIQNVGSSTNRAASHFSSEIWSRIREGLKRMNLLEKNITTSKPESLKQYIYDLIAEHPERRILLMFDEADNFLDADSQADFQVTLDLKTLMANTQRRFKVVLAGLQNVQRFQGIPNQPLAQFGTPIQIGPLDPPDAEKLVREALEVIGFEIDEPTVLRILSYTNYHAGLIQFFCKRLVERMTKNPAYGEPPFKIERADVESVYRDHDVKDEIRQRLELTLKLSTRYQAVVWTLIIEQKSERDSYARAFAASEVLNLVQVYWQKGFEKVQTDKMRSILDELCGLGVLVKNSDGYYRLRSPNVVRLMGTIDDMEARLEEIAQTVPEEEFKPDDHHTALDNRFQQYSPLTYAQERDVTHPDFGMSIIFASSALGLDYLPAALRQIVPEDLLNTGVGIFEKAPADLRRSKDLVDFLSICLTKEQKAEQFVVMVQPSCKPEELKELAEGVLSFCDRKRSRVKKRWMKVIFILMPDMIENWTTLSGEERKKIENKCDAVLSPKLWNEVGITHRLNQLNKLSSPEVSEMVARSTGGWPFLLDHLFDRFKNENNLTEPCKRIEETLLHPDSELRRCFLNAVSLGGLSATPVVLNEFIRERSIHKDLVDELRDLIEEKEVSGISQADVRRSVAYLQRLQILYSVVDDSDGNVIRIDPVIRKILLSDE